MKNLHEKLDEHISDLCEQGVREHLKYEIVFYPERDFPEPRRGSLRLWVEGDRGEHSGFTEAVGIAYLPDDYGFDTIEDLEDGIEGYLKGRGFSKKPRRINPDW